MFDEYVKINFGGSGWIDGFVFTTAYDRTR